eukprot:TRINITY_DN61342_c0_g1_i1.p1 TRINITY_DN61342_c0_g1~~TRINITY_DN61342_c0_g1_i1.p1  ORF type:complete len:1023 (+),score=145.67 TRINITY_DN61342_c0_g1_i1:390-3071(+)
MQASAGEYISALLGAACLEELDLSWNSFNSSVFRTLGRSVCEHEVLRHLRLENASGCRGLSGEAAITSFLETLARDKTLRFLDVSSNTVDHDAALVLEEALENHAQIEEVRVSGNPLGAAGMRCLLRLFFSEQAPKLLRFACSNCTGQGLAAVGFSVSCPAGRYELDLSNPSQRPVLRKLYKGCEHFGLKIEECFRNVTYSLGGTFPHPTGKDSFGVWCVLEEGTLSVAFCIDAAFDKKGFQFQEPKRVPSRCAFRFWESFLQRFRLRPSAEKMIQVLVHWREFHDRTEQELFLRALSCDFSISFDFILNLCQECGNAGAKSAGSALPPNNSWSPKSVAAASVAALPGSSPLPAYIVISSLLHCLPGGRAAMPHALYMSLPHLTLTGYLILADKSRAFASFNIDHATGSYTLDLGNCTDRAVAQSILFLDRWEAGLAKAQGRVDTSVHGNWSNVRNCMYAGDTSINLANEWRLPSTDKVDLDFTSWRRPPANAVAIPDGIWAQMLMAFNNSPCNPEGKVDCIRRIAHLLFVRACHLREILGLLLRKHDRLDVIAVLFHRLVDPQNVKLIRGRLSNTDEWESLQRRIGTLNCLPFWQPEGHTYTLDLTTYEDRMATCCVVQLAFKERQENIRNQSWRLADGSFYNFSMGTPAGWDTFATVPEEGKLSFQYVCSATDRRMDQRNRDARVIGGWQVGDMQADDVSWWKTCSECVPEMLEYVYHLMREFSDPETHFKRIVGNTTKTTISRQEWEQALQREDWKPFRDDPELSKQVFRAIDVDNNGEITESEFSVVTEVWRDLQLSILEYLKQLQRAFQGDLDQAFRELDNDGSGNIELTEWLDATRTMGFFGPSTAIFQLLANNKKIDHESWMKLHRVYDSRVAIMAGISGSMQGSC